MARPLFPGTFDPPTWGHLDLIDRALRVFGRLCVAVAVNPSKTPAFPVEERIDLLRSCLDRRERVEIRRLDGLVVDFCRRHGYDVIVRGLRTVSDLEYEHAMAWTNRELMPEIETVFLVPSLEHAFTSSTLIKDIARHGGDVRRFVPDVVARRLEERR